MVINGFLRVSDSIYIANMHISDIRGHAAGGASAKCTFFKFKEFKGSNLGLNVEKSVCFCIILSVNIRMNIH